MAADPARRRIVAGVLELLDLRLLRLLRTRGHAPAIERAIIVYSRLGEDARLWYAIAGLGLLLHRGRRRTYLRAARAIFIGQVANTAAKLAVRRARPLIEDLPALSPSDTALSYPSSHATTSFAAAGALRRALPAAPLYAAAVAMAASRPYLGLHYPSDVIVGAMLGTVLARTAA